LKLSDNSKRGLVRYSTGLAAFSILYPQITQIV